MEQYNTLCEFLDEQDRITPRLTAENEKAFVKAWGKIHGHNFQGVDFARYKKIMVSISGGADSDIMLDMIERIGCMVRKGLQVVHMEYSRAVGLL